MHKIFAGQGGQGCISLSGDKSISHRLILFSLLHQGCFKVTNLSQGQDVASSLKAFSALGGQYRQLSATRIELTGLNGNFIPKASQIDCENSGTTARLLAGILAGRPGNYKLSGDQSLSRRPMERITAPLRLMGARVEATDGHLPIYIAGSPKLKPVQYKMPVASAQVKSAILLAACQAQGTSRISNCQSSRDHSERLLSLLGAKINFNENFVELAGPFKSQGDYEFYVPGDLSSAAFFIVAATLLPGSDILLQNILLNPGRATFIKVLQKMGARIEIDLKQDGCEPMGDIRVRYAPQLHSVKPEPAIIPMLIDELPVLSIAMAFASGVSKIENAKELRVKESDRIATLCQALSEAGAEVTERPDGYTISGNPKFKPGGCLRTGNDHRIAVALSILGLKSKEAILLDNTNCSKISFPEFEQKFLPFFSSGL